MIRSTKNESISSLTKQRHTGDMLTTTGVKSQSYELIESATGVISEVRDEFDSHTSNRSDFPSNAFNGTFE